MLHLFPIERGGACLTSVAFAQVDSSWAEVEAARPHVCALLAPAGTHMDLNIGAALWLAAGADGHVACADGQRRRYRSARSHTGTLLRRFLTLWRSAHQTSDLHRCPSSPLRQFPSRLAGGARGAPWHGR